MSCNKDCIEKPFRSQYICSGTNETKCKYTSNITNLDTALLPKGVINMVQTRNKHALVKYVQNHPALYFKTYNFSQMLKFNYNLVGRNKVGCCYKMLWRTQGSGKRFVSFNDMANLYTFTIRISQNFSVRPFILSTVLGSLQKMNLARHMISNNKQYPYQNIVKNRKTILGKNGKKLINCNCFNKLNYKDYKKMKLNEYFRWFNETKVFTPYKRK
jgi:hypothetical protein